MCFLGAPQRLGCVVRFLCGSAPPLSEEWAALRAGIHSGDGAPLARWVEAELAFEFGTLIGELQELFARHNAGAALTAKAVFKPSKDFHTARHTLFTPEQNLEIDSRAPSGRCETDAAVRHPARGEGQGMSRVNVVPVGASVKTKLGRGGGEE